MGPQLVSYLSPSLDGMIYADLSEVTKFLKAKLKD